MHRSRLPLTLWSCCIGLAALAGCARATADAVEPTLVFAAANLREALTDVVRSYRETGGDSIVLVFGSTGDLTTQIANGAPADLLLAANEAAVDSLQTLGLIDVDTREVYAVGRVALITRCAPAPDGAEDSAAPCEDVAVQDLPKPRFRAIAIADPRYAPYGLAARQVLERAGVYERVKEKLVMGANVSQAEQFVSSGNAEVGLVALSLVINKRGVHHYVVDSSLHDPLAQAAAVLARAEHPGSAAALLQFLRSASGAAILERYGFLVPPATPPRTQ